MEKKHVISGLIVVVLVSLLYTHFDANPSADSLTGFAVGGQSRYQQLKACVDSGQDLNACRLSVGSMTPEEFERTAGGAGAGGAGGQAIAGAAVAGLPSKEELHQLILANWRNQKQRLANYFHETFRKGVPSRTYSLYAIQGETNGLLRYAGKKKDIQLLDELASLYLVPVQYLETVSEYQYKYLGDEFLRDPKTYYTLFKLPLDRPRRIWKADADIIQDSMLEAGQFLFVVSDAYVIFLSIPPEQRTENMRRFLQEYSSILKEHYFAWMYDDPKLYQRKGWACQHPADKEVNGYDFLTKLLNLELGATNGEPRSHCNYYSDAEMWVAVGAANLLRADAKVITNGEPALLTPEEKQKALAYVDLATRLMKSRTTESSLTDFNGQPVAGYNFGIDQGLQDHPEFAYAGYEGTAFPNDGQRIKASRLGWDFSHASRFVYAFTALNDALEVTGQDWPNREHIRRFANQFAYGTFNKDLQRPLFTNYVDGTNGWFLVNRGWDPASGKPAPGTGIPPYGSSESGHAGGWAQWYSFNPDIGKIMASLWKVARSTDVVDQSGNNLAASLASSTAITPDGKIKSGARITGQGDISSSIDCGAHPQLRSPTGSFEAWVQFDQAHLGEIQDIAHVYKNQGEEFYVVKSSDGTIWVLIRDYVNGNSVTYVNMYFPGAITDAGWHHLVVAQDGRELKLYVDGTLLQAATKDGVNLKTWTDFLDMDAPRAGCTLGYSGNGMNGQKFFGVMDEVRFYNKGLSGDEVRAHYQGIFPDRDEHLVAHWDFNSADTELIDFKREFYGSPAYENFRKRESLEHFQPRTSVIMLQFLSSLSDIVDASEEN